MKYFTTAYYFRKLDADNRLKKHLGSLYTEHKLNELLASDDYGTVLFEMDLSKMPYPQPNCDLVLYDSDDLMVHVINPNDYRIAHPAFCAANVPTPTCNVHFTRYPHPSTGFDESGLKNKDGLWFGMIDHQNGIIATNFVHQPYDLDPTIKTKTKIYVRIVPVVSEVYLRNQPCILKFKIGRSIPEDEMKRIDQMFRSLVLGNALPEDLKLLDQDNKGRPYYVGDELFLYPYRDYLRSGDEFLIITSDFRGEDHMDLMDFIELLKKNSSNSNNYEVRYTATVIDRYFGKLFFPHHIKNPSVARAKRRVYDFSVPDYLYRDPFGDFGGMITLLSFQFSPVLKMLHFPADIAIESIIAAESEKARWMTLSPDDSGLPIDADASKLFDALSDDDGEDEGSDEPTGEDQDDDDDDFLFDDDDSDDD